MGSIQTGFIQVQKPQQTSYIGSKIQTGRVISNITSADEAIRQKYFSEIAAQKKAYEDELAKENADIAAQNALIEKYNADLQAAYDKAVSDIKNMTIEEYDSYYYTIPENVRAGFQTPEELSKQIILDKEQRAKDTLDEINKLIDDYQVKYAYWDEQYNKRSGEGADYADQRRLEAEYHIEELNNAKSYATGDYNKDEVIQTAQWNASNRFTHNEELVSYDRLQKVEEAKQIAEYKEQGYQPVYKYPQSQLQELIGFVPTGTSQQQIKEYTQSFYTPIISSTQVKTSQIPQNVLTIGLNKQIVSGESQDQLGSETTTTESYYVDKLGNPISYQQQYFLNQPKSKQIPFNQVSPFYKYNNPLVNAALQSRKSPYIDFNLTTRFIDIPLSQQRGTIGSATYRIVPNFEDIPLEENVLSIVTGLGDLAKGSSEKFFSKTLKQPLTQDIFYNLPQEERGTMITNPSTLKLELAQPQKVTVPTIFGATSNVIGAAPELAAWAFIPEVISVPYAIRGAKVALNPSLTTTERIFGGLETGSSLAFGYGGKVLKYLPKSEVIIETKKVKIPKQEPIIGLSQENPIAVYGGETKYRYKVKSITPEITSTVGQQTKIYKNTIWNQLLGNEPKLVYSGIPYSDRTGYKKAIKLLGDYGYKEKEIKSLLRFTAPKVAETVISGEAFAIFGDNILKPKVYLKAEQITKPKIIEGLYTKKFEPMYFNIKSPSLEVISKGGTSYYYSIPEYTKSYITPEGNIFSKLKQQGKTKDVFEQLTSIKSIKNTKLNVPLNDIEYAKTFKTIESDIFQDVSLSRKLLPKERKWYPSKSKIITSSLEQQGIEPIIITREEPFKIIPNIDTGTISGKILKKGEKTEQQKLIALLESKPKQLSLFKDVDKSLKKEQETISEEIISKQIPKVPTTLKQPKIKYVEIPEISVTEIPQSAYYGKGLYERASYSENVNYPLKNIRSVDIAPDVKDTVFGDLSDIGSKGDLTGSGKFEGLGDLGKIENLGVVGTRFSNGYIDLPKESSKPNLKYLNDMFNIENIKSKIKQKQNFLQKQDIKQKQDFLQKEEIKQATETSNVFDDRNDKTRGFKPPTIRFTSQPTKKQKEVLSKAFTVLLRSKGKVIEIGKGLPYYKALKLGVSKSKSSLAQTFALRESGTTRESDISYRVPAHLFTTPKRRKTMITPLTFVERRGKTLTERTEVGQLLKSKKSKGKKIKWL